MPHGGRLTLRTANVLLDAATSALYNGGQSGPYVLLAVRDTGVGMDAEVQAHLFEPFFTTKGPGKGTGLGLATVYGIVKQSGGFIAVVSAPGAGSTFRVMLPHADGPAESAPPACRPADRLTGTETVLLVEDEAVVRDVAGEILARHGYTVLPAAHPGEAVMVAEAHAGPIHLLLTDVVMPKASGPDLAHRLLIGRPGLRVLYMSGYTDEHILHQEVLSRGRAFLPKPFKPDTLARKVREVLDRPD